MYGITDLTTFVLGTVFIVLLPGPNSVFVLSAATRHGIRPGYWAAAGVFAGDTILMLLASTGAASLLYANPTLFTVLKYAGAAYLAWIGFGLLRQARTNWRARATIKTGSGESPLDGHRELTEHLPSGAGVKWLRPASDAPFRSALVISLLNPKAIFFFISFFVQFVNPQYEYPALTFLLLGVIVQICSVAYLAALIHGGAHLARRLRVYPWINALGATAVGGIFIWFGIKLATATLG